MFHALLLDGLALHLRPQNLRRPFTEGLFDDRARAVGDAVEFVDLVVQFCVRFLDRRFFVGLHLRKVAHASAQRRFRVCAGVGNKPRCVKACGYFIALVPRGLGVMDAPCKAGHALSLLCRCGRHGQPTDDTCLPRTKGHERLQEILSEG